MQCLAHCMLHTTHSILHTTHYTLHTTYCTLHTTHYTLHTTYCTLLTTYCTLHTAYCTQHTAYCTLHIEGTFLPCRDMSPSGEGRDPAAGDVAVSIPQGPRSWAALRPLVPLLY